MTKEEFLAFRLRVANECHQQIALATVPLYKGNMETVEKTGSGVLLAIADHRFLLTAAHVADFSAIHPQYLAPCTLDAPPIPLDEVKIYTSPIPPGVDREDAHMRKVDPFDVAVFELLPSVAEKITEPRRFIRLMDIDASTEQIPGLYIVTGYPIEFTKPNFSHKLIYSKPLPYVTGLYQGGCEPHWGSFIALEYSYQSVDVDGALQQMPHPSGMSGCGIWRLAEASKPADLWKPTDVRLVAIEHTWSRKNGAILGTFVRYALSMIYNNYPSLRPVFELAYPRLDIAVA
jgi:hypothetical protein